MTLEETLNMKYTDDMILQNYENAKIYYAEYGIDTGHFHPTANSNGKFKIKEKISK